ncbi:glutamate synthase large subunit [Kallotenue papyrolyticum]|uniref:glutamate synthase large subunit n=1 Tax=Kallotenue papyrolyticum TaxID=1325125 RepID=UPI00047859BB|nr:glutamate synthase large subunit [Kallotenue papyrolyticum]
MNTSSSAPLYDPRWEHDACGIGFVTRLDARPSHEIVELALEALCHLEHRGALDADGKSGDGAGILTQIPYDFFAHYLKRARLDPPAPGDLAVAMCFLPFHHLSEARALIEEHLAAAGIPLLAWRAVPTNDGTLGAQAMLLKPVIMQALLARPATIAPADWERALYRTRRAIGLEAHRRAMEGFYIASMSSRTIVYKGLMQASQLGVFYPDLQEPLYRSALAVYHQRYSTNTFPSWERAQPFRLLCHNGEINTLSGNVAAIKSREPDFASPLWEDVACLRPVIDERGSDSAMLDNVLELLTLSGRDVRHALTMLVPPAWEHDASLDEDLRAFFQFHSCLLAPWDGPAALCFSDGSVVGMALDRNGLRPARYIITADGLIVAGSEVGAVSIDPERIVRKGRLGPGQMIAVDLQAGQFMDDIAIKRWLAARAPYRAWVSEQLQTLNVALTPGTANGTPAEEAPLACLQAAFGYDAESLQVVLKPMARDGHEPVGSMGDDTPIAPLSLVGRPLYGYFRQRFAQVTNPPIDPLREALVMSLAMNLGPIGNLLDESPAHAHMLRIERPILRAAELEALRAHPDPAFRSCTIAALWPVADGAAGLQAAVWRMLEAIEAAIRDGVTIVILSDRGVDAAHAPIPALLAVGAAHHHLLRLGLRARVSLVLESGEPREVHHMACLIGYGAEAIHPYLAIASVRHMASEERQREALDPDQAEANYLQALDEGLRKILSKMGISTIDSYHGAQLFEAIGIGEELIDACFAGTPSRIGGIGWADVAEDVLSWHRRAFPTPATLPTPGVYKFKKDGEYHAFSPQVVHALHQAVGLKPTNGSLRDAYRQYVTLLYERAPATPRDLLRWKTRTPIALEEVEPVEAILRRFSTAAMSIGATSPEAHEVLAIAMKRLGGMSNSGEGGEDPERYHDERNSDIKQVASGRFGVTPAYLMHARELQIKMAQGSKPGEGGQIPGHKVTDYIARLRHTTPGVTLISPPPHHDIYSIEDLAQLIYDLKQINPQADVSVKLVAEVGVGTVAAGVVKAGADVVHISGHSGGTGASPLSSIKNAGIAWELGLAETQQTLLLNGLRDRVRVRVDGGFQTGRDVIIAALLGADEYSFGTAAVVAEGCLMARTCHTNNCPVGIASQRPELRAKFPGTPENVMHFFLHLAEEVRELLAALGARTLDEIIGRVELLEQITTGETRADQLDLSPLLVSPAAPDDLRRWSGARRSAEVGYLNARIVDDVLDALEQGQPIQLTYPIANTDRTVGATLAGEIARRDLRLAPDTIELIFHGSAGQSFGAFATQGMRLILWGDANDYVGKGLGGGEIIVRPPEGVRYRAAESTIMGNTVLYGATGGALWAAGQAGERFAVRNSGALAVVEGIGDHGCEYMTGGLVVVLGPTGRNFGAGMSGGRAYVLDERGDFLTRINPDMIRVEALSEDWQFDELRALIEQHVLLTGSRRGQELLQQWASVRQRFWHVIPTAITPTPLLLRERRAVEQALTPVIA